MQSDYGQALFDALPDAAILLDKSGRIIDWSPAATTFFGYHKKEVLGRSINLIYEQNHPFPKIIQEILPIQKKWSTETRFVRKNGAKGYCSLAITSFMHPEQNKLFAIITHHSISEFKEREASLKNTISYLSKETQLASEMNYFLTAHYNRNDLYREQLEKNLRESELHFHLLAENATDVISRFAPDGSYLYASPSCKGLLGYTPNELVGRNFYKMVHHDDLLKLKKAFTRRKPSNMHHTITYRVRRKEGDHRWFESTIRLIRDEENKVIREIQSASRDVTDRVLDKKARLRGQQLAHVFRLSTMEEMASGMAHEICQPLSAIVNYTQGCVRHIQNNHHEPSQLLEIMKKAVAQAERAGEVIQRLKNFFCKGQLVKTACKVNSLIRETVSLIRNDLNTTQTKIDFTLDKEVPLVSVDRIQIQQVILNLIQNAMEAMHAINPKQRRIMLLTKSEQNFIEIKVSDNGPGFSREVINRVFEPFFTTKANGRGMGLAICRSIIEAHGGQFTINPNTNNQSWIRFTLPID